VVLAVFSYLGHYKKLYDDDDDDDGRYRYYGTFQSVVKVLTINICRTSWAHLSYCQ